MNAGYPILLSLSAGMLFLSGSCARCHAASVPAAGLGITGAERQIVAIPDHGSPVPELQGPPCLNRYEGSLAAVPDVADFPASVPERVSRGIAATSRLLGRDFSEYAGRVVVILSDAPDSRDTFLMETTSRIHAGGVPRAYIRVYVHNLISLRMDADETFTHEMNHALLRLWLGQRNTELPDWFREGIAIAAAGDGEERLRGLLAETLGRAEQGKRDLDSRRLVEEVCDGLPREGVVLRDYAEAWLWVDFLRDKIGWGGIRGLLEDVAGGAAFEASALTRLAMSAWGDVTAAAHTHAVKAAARIENGDTARYCTARAARKGREKDLAGAMGEGCWPRVREDGQESFADDLYLYETLKALAFSDPKAALPLLAQALEGPLRGTPMAMSSLVLLARSAESAGRTDLQRVALERVAYGCPHEPIYSNWARRELGKLISPQERPVR